MESVSSYTFINADVGLHVHLSMLFNAMLIHGVSPRNMLMSTLVPIPKNKNKSLNDSDNYRAIALGSIVCKVLDNILLEKHSDVFVSDQLQFGFKAGHSTTHCSFILHEVVDHYIQNGSIGRIKSV